MPYDKSLNKCELGGIVKHNGGQTYGFTVTFQSPLLCQHYKEMMMYILRSDELKVKRKTGYYDKKKD